MEKIKDQAQCELYSMLLVKTIQHRIDMRSKGLLTTGLKNALEKQENKLVELIYE